MSTSPIDDLNTQYNLASFPYLISPTSGAPSSAALATALATEMANSGSFLDPPVMLPAFIKERVLLNSNNPIIGTDSTINTSWSTGSVLPAKQITDWASFINEWRKRLVQAAVPAGFLSTDPYAGASFTAFYSSWAASVGLPTSLSFPSNPVASDLGQWASLAGSFDLSSGAALEAQLKSMFNAAFSQFLTEYKKEILTRTPYPSTSGFLIVTPPSGATSINIDQVVNPTNAADLSNFTNAWNKFMSRSTVLDESALSGVNNNLQSYERAFEAQFPGLAQDQYERVLSQFASSVILNTGTFIPSQNYEQWLNYLRLRDRPQISATGVPVVSPVLTPSGQVLFNNDIAIREGQLLFKLFKQLTAMIGIIQRVAAAQAERLKFFAEWQKAYSDLMLQFPSFTAGDNSLIGFGPLGKSKPAIDARSDINTAGTAIIQTLTTQRQIVTDSASQFQANVNQSNDAASQQASIATSILQQMSGILASIFP